MAAKGRALSPATSHTAAATPQLQAAASEPWTCAPFPDRSEPEQQGSRRGAAEGEGLGNNFLSHIAAVDGIFHVCRGFEDTEVTHVEDRIDPVADLDIIHGCAFLLALPVGTEDPGDRLWVQRAAAAVWCWVSAMGRLEQVSKSRADSLPLLLAAAAARAAQVSQELTALSRAGAAVCVSATEQRHAQHRLNNCQRCCG